MPEGANLRKEILKKGISPHNDGARLLNCHGFGTCGTCAVEVRGSLSAATKREKWRLNFYPHQLKEGLRLACQSKVLGDIIVEKHPGFWGTKRGK